MRRRKRKRRVDYVILKTDYIGGLFVMYCPKCAWSNTIIRYDGRLFSCGCPNCGRFYKDKNLLKAVNKWDDFVGAEQHKETREHYNNDRD